MALSKQLFPTWITVIPNIFCNVSSHILIYKCVTMPYLIQTVCDGCGQCVYLEHSPICHSLSPLSLAPLPAAAGAAGGRHNLRRLLSLNHRDPSSRHPPPSPPSHQHGHSTFTQARLNKWYSSIQIWYYCLYSVKMYQQVWFVCTNTVHIIYIYYLK